MKVKKMVFLSLLVALALAVSLLEAAFPLPIAVPGAKLGLSNIVILVTLIQFGFKEAVIVSALKSFLLMLATGSVTSFAYSLAGSLLSSVMMGVSQHCFSPPFSPVGISEIGAFAFNIGQLSVAAFVLSNIGVFYYLPVLTLIGLVTGYFVGLSARLITEHMNRVSRFR